MMEKLVKIQNIIKQSLFHDPINTNATSFNQAFFFMAYKRTVVRLNVTSSSVLKELNT